MIPRRRCAVYTRKSTEEGLDQAFNSLDAQREACEAFIKSQTHEGWTCSREAYDDGGYSGGSMDRPALQRLLADIAAGKIDVVVVYKVDRLTRSLADFAKIVEIFDAKGVSFVSVTQQFNTTSSMGQLTLNVLLSFAQFEREVTGERIRDKIAASKKKGLWMGGAVPLGYDVKDRALVINSAEAETVRTVFKLYRRLGTVRKLKEEADRQGLVTKRREVGGRMTGGGPFTRGHLYCLLSNLLYVGDVAHKGTIYPGAHQPIIDRETFDAVQKQLASHAAERQSAINGKAPSLLTGLIFDERGDRLCPTHANKKGTRYRYYISKRLMHEANTSTDGWRLPASELEAFVIRVIREFFSDELRLVEALGLARSTPDHIRETIAAVGELGNRLTAEDPGRQRSVLTVLVHRITLDANAMRMELKRAGIASLIAGKNSHPDADREGTLTVAVPFEARRRGVEAKLVMQAAGEIHHTVDDGLVAILFDAQRWLNALVTGEVSSLRDLARRSGRDVSEISRSLPLAFLAPRIVAAILDGRQPVNLAPRRLKRIDLLPATWQDQWESLGFSGQVL